MKMWGAVAVGLGLIPAMPLIDEPVEHGIDMAFDYVWPVKASVKDSDEDKKDSKT